MLSDYFSIDIMVEMFEVLHQFQILAFQYVRIAAVGFFAVGWAALSVEGDERQETRFFRRGYGYGLTMIIVGLLFGVLDWFMNAFALTFTNNSDPLMMLRMSSDSIAQDADPLKVAAILASGYASVLGFIYLVVAGTTAIKASHRMEGGATSAIKYFGSSMLLFVIARFFRDWYNS